MTSPAKVLVAEDDPECASVFDRWLKSEGYDVTIVGSLAEAQSLRALEASFDALVLDVRLGKDDGRAIAKLYPKAKPITVSGEPGYDLQKPTLTREQMLALLVVRLSEV